MIRGGTFYSIAYDLEIRKVNESRYVLLVFTDDVALKYYRHYFRGNKNIILKSFDSIRRSGLAGLRYKEYFVLNFITSIEEIKDELEMFINKYSGIDGKIKSTPLLNHIKELKEGK